MGLELNNRGQNFNGSQCRTASTCVANRVAAALWGSQVCDEEGDEEGLFQGSEEEPEGLDH